MKKKYIYIGKEGDKRREKRITSIMKDYETQALKNLSVEANTRKKTRFGRKMMKHT